MPVPLSPMQKVTARSTIHKEQVTNKGFLNNLENKREEKQKQLLYVWKNLVFVNVAVCVCVWERVSENTIIKLTFESAC